MGAQLEKRVAVDPVRAMVLYMQGNTDAEMADRLGVSKSAVGTWRRINGLSANKRAGAAVKGGHKLSPLAADALAAREMGLSYGQFKAKQYIGEIEEKARQEAIFAARRKAKAEREAAAARAREVLDYGGDW